ncbi:hypothetical protein V6Z11_D13G136800 [Gossypium hirsutum]
MVGRLNLIATHPTMAIHCHMLTKTNLICHYAILKNQLKKNFYTLKAMYMRHPPQHHMHANAIRGRQMLISRLPGETKMRSPLPPREILHVTPTWRLLTSYL